MASRSAASVSPASARRRSGCGPSPSPFPGPPFSEAKTIDDAKARFKAPWLSFKDKHGAEALAKAYAETNDANRPERYRR
jgi:hypothetical protein